MDDDKDDVIAPPLTLIRKSHSLYVACYQKSNSMFFPSFVTFEAHYMSTGRNRRSLYVLLTLVTLTHIKHSSQGGLREIRLSVLVNVMLLQRWSSCAKVR